MHRNKAFTLIELLIVVAIIAILAAIAVPNFLEAQTRSKVARVNADQRTLATAIESYRIDNNDYPPAWQLLIREGKPFSFPEDKFIRWRLVPLTTPIAYTTSLPETPFLPKTYSTSSGPITLAYNVGGEYEMAFIDGWYDNTGPMLAGANPDTTRYHFRDAGPDYDYSNSINGLTNLMPYDPTNGTVSIGDIWRFGP